MMLEAKRPQVLGLALVLLLCWAGLATAQIPHKINYQGRVTHISSGVPLPGGHTMTFRIYDGPAGGNLLWTETQTVVADMDGVVSTLLGDVIPLDIAFEGLCWLEIEVDGEILSPRREMVSSAYAYFAENAKRLGGLESSSYALDGHIHDERYYTETELNTSDGDPPNQGSNRMSWDNLTDVPPDIADGVGVPVGSAGQTLRHDGTGWVANSLLFNNGARIGIGTTAPARDLDVAGCIRTDEFRLGDPQASDGSLLMYRNGTALPIAMMQDYNDRGAILALGNTAGGTYLYSTPDPDGSGGWFGVFRDMASYGFWVDGNYEGSQQPKMIVHGSDRAAAFYMGRTGDQSVDLPVDAISGPEILDEPGVAADVGADVILPVGSDLATIHTHSIVVPGPGYVLAMARASIQNVRTVGNTSDATFYVFIDGQAGSFAKHRLPDAMPSGVYHFPISLFTMDTVTAAGTVTCTFEGVAWEGDYTVKQPHIALVYFPTAYGSMYTIAKAMSDASGVDGLLGAQAVRADRGTSRTEAQDFNAARIERELADMRARLEALEGEVPNIADPMERN